MRSMISLCVLVVISVKWSDSRSFFSPRSVGVDPYHYQLYQPGSPNPYLYPVNQLYYGNPYPGINQYSAGHFPPNLFAGHPTNLFGGLPSPIPLALPNQGGFSPFPAVQGGQVSIDPLPVAPVDPLPENVPVPENQIAENETPEEGETNEENVEEITTEETEEGIDITKIRDHTELVGVGEDGQTLAIGKLKQYAKLNGKLIPVSFEYALTIPDGLKSRSNGILDENKSLFFYLPNTQSGDYCPDCIFLLDCQNSIDGHCLILPVLPQILPHQHSNLKQDKPDQGGLETLDLGSLDLSSRTVQPSKPVLTGVYGHMMSTLVY